MSCFPDKPMPEPGERWVVVALGQGTNNGTTEVVEVVRAANSGEQVRVLRTVSAYIPVDDFLKEVE